MGTLSNEQIGNATGLFNLLRNIGGSVGISMVNTIVIRHEQIRHSELIQHITPAAPLYRQLLVQVQRLATERRGAGVAVECSYALVSRLVDQQAATLSYVDIFRDLALISFFCVPLVLLLKK
jgi:MFS transporter, DHA2 family, multidrug resistance protein